MATTYALTVDLTGIEKLATGLGNITAERIGARLVDAVNAAADSAYALSRKTMLSGIKLTDPYLQSNMQVSRATPAQPVATITAFGGREFLTGLSNYGAMQEVQRAQGTSRGSPRRGIPPRMKSAGLSVDVVGARKSLPFGFTMPGKKDRSGNPLVFVRGKDGQIRTPLGPSTYQLFRLAAEGIEDDVYADLGERVASATLVAFQEELS